MNENELKSIERYFNKFNEDPASFNEFEANDFFKLLKKTTKNKLPFPFFKKKFKQHHENPLLSRRGLTA